MTIAEADTRTGEVISASNEAAEKNLDEARKMAESAGFTWKKF
ncbi:hypothetical protein ACQUW5_12475 [Legionella sp. CNM-1927-20]